MTEILPPCGVDLYNWDKQRSFFENNLEKNEALNVIQILEEKLTEGVRCGVRPGEFYLPLIATLEAGKVDKAIIDKIINLRNAFIAL